LVIAGSDVAAQQVTVSTPFQSNNDSFFERMGTHWGFNWGSANFSFGGPNMALPQFGGFDPSAGVNGGMFTQRGDFSGFFNFSANQGYRQSFVSQTPSVTLMNGVPGFISDTSQSPFVISYIPVVGGFPTVGQMMPMVPPSGLAVARLVQPISPPAPGMLAMMVLVDWPESSSIAASQAGMVTRASVSDEPPAL
ncbi:hypothetical protein LCGC14_1709710, partial [marine sediment metagenome]